jgi:moderate conductance mechanosensitive channel
MMSVAQPAAATNASVSEAAVAAAPVVAEPSAGQKLFSGFGALWRNLAALEPGEVAINLGLSVLVLVAVAFAIWLMRRLLHSGIGALAAKGVVADQPVALSKGPPRIAKFSWLLLRAIVVLTAIILLLSIWGLDLLGWLTETGAGATLSRLVGVLLIAVALIEVAGHIINRALKVLSRKSDGGRRTAQMKTLAPLVRGIVQGFIIVVTALTVLSELGVKIGPLLASAGVVGIAVGFGAQTLVKDFLTGMFLVIEDIVAVGDNVDIGGRTGTVEAMTLRTIRVRNMDGTLHVLPYSEAQVISNRTQTFSAYVFNIGVAYNTDFDHAFAVMRQVGEAIQANPEFGPKILQPLEIMGVDQLADSSVILKARFRTRPGQQWLVGREYNRRVKEAFDAEGIEIPFPIRQLVSDSPGRDDRLAEARGAMGDAGGSDESDDA